MNICVHGGIVQGTAVGAVGHPTAALAEAGIIKLYSHTDGLRRATPQSSILSRIFADPSQGCSGPYIMDIPGSRGTTNLFLMLDLVIN